jgi:ABC-type multidrug transport system fused ATPase/permease subunit
LLGNSITVGIAGLVLTYTQQITGLMNWAVRMACEVENRMTNVERNVEYASLEPEEPSVKSKLKQISETSHSLEVTMGGILDQSKKTWPVNGHIVFNNVNIHIHIHLNKENIVLNLISCIF